MNQKLILKILFVKSLNTFKNKRQILWNKNTYN